MPEVRLAVDKVASWYPSPEVALNQCAAAREHLTEKLGHLGITDLQLIEVRGPVGATRPHPNLQAGHQVLRIGSEVVDVTWAQIDIEGGRYCRIYPSVESLREDWTELRDWSTGDPI